MPANTNEWTTRIAAGDPEPTAEHTRDTLACHRYLSIEARRRGKRVTISFSYLTLDFLLLTQIKLLAEVEKLLGVGEDCARFIAAGRRPS